MVLARYARQNAWARWSEEEGCALARRLWSLIEARGLPRALAKDEMGTAGEMSANEVAPLVAAVLEGVDGAERERLGDPARQLVKACFQPEFRQCRESYRKVDASGVCRRQQLAKARARVSGTHCVDCPYWLTLTAEQHAGLLAKGWGGEVTEFWAERAVFLPEDFRALRRFVRSCARR